MTDAALEIRTADESPFVALENVVLSDEPTPDNAGYHVALVNAAQIRQEIADLQTLVRELLTMNGALIDAVNTIGQQQQFVTNTITEIGQQVAPMLAGGKGPLGMMMKMMMGGGRNGE